MIQVIFEDDDTGRIDSCRGSRANVRPWITFLFERPIERRRVAKGFLLPVNYQNSVGLNDFRRTCLSLGKAVKPASAWPLVTSKI